MPAGGRSLTAASKKQAAATAAKKKPAVPKTYQKKTLVAPAYGLRGPLAKDTGGRKQMPKVKKQPPVQRAVHAVEHVLTPKGKGTRLVKKAEKQGKVPHSPAMALAGRVPFVQAKDVKEAEQAVLNMPGGVYALGKAVVGDIAKPKHGPFSFTGTRTLPILKALGKASYRDIRHPLRNPLMTALTGSAIISAGAGAVSRGAAAGAAAREAGAAGRSATKAAGGAALKRPVPGPRTHYFEGQPIRGRYSTSAAARGVQKAADVARGKRGAPLLHPKPKPGVRMSTISARKAERLLSEERRVTDAAAKAPHLKALALSHDVSTPQDMAIRVAAEGMPVNDVLEAHLRAAAQVEDKLRRLKRGGVPASKGHVRQQALNLKGKNEDLLRKAALLKEAKKYLTEDEAGAPKLVPALERHYQAGRQSALIRENRLKKAGLLTLEQAEYRKHAPGRFAQRTVSGGRAIEVTRPRTLEEAKVELAKLDKQVNKSMSALTKREMGEHYADIKLEAELAQRSRPKSPYRGQEIIRYKHGGKIDIQRTGDTARYVEPENRVRVDTNRTMQDIAEARVIKRLRDSKHPLAQDFVKMIDQAAELRQIVQAHEEPAWMQQRALPDLGTTKEFKGFEEVQPYIGGKFRVPDVLVSERKGFTHGPLAYRGGVPRKPGTLTHGYTGALRHSGKYTPHTLKAIAEDALDAERYLSVDRFRNRILPMGHKVRPADTRFTKYVPLRERNLKPGEAHQLREMLKNVDPENLSVDEAARVEAALDHYRSQVFPVEGRDVPLTAPGEAVPGVVWVDRKLLGSQAKLVGRVPVYDVAADAMKGLILYGKPGYVAPNVVGNVAFNIFQQGLLAPANWARAVRLPRDLGFMVDEVMGEGFSRALAEGTMSPISLGVRRAGNFWSYFVDKPFRRAAFIHEARIRGFKTNDQMRALIQDSGHRSELGEVAQRSRDAIIDYERLGPIERDIVRRVLFVYPWVKGSTYYFGQFLRDHPILAAVFTKLGQQGQALADKELGPRPAWAEGSFKVGGSQDFPLAINPTAVSPFSTPAQVSAAGRSLFQPVERSQQIGEMFGPVIQAGYEALTGRETFTGRDLKSGAVQNFAGQLVKGTPQYQLAQRLMHPQKAEQPAEGQRAKTYPYSQGQALGQFVAGSSFPRPINRKQLNAQAQGPLSPIERAHANAAKLRKDLFAGIARDPSWTPQDKHDLDQAITRWAEVDGARLQTRLQVGAHEPYLRAVMLREAELLHRWGEFSNSDLRDARRASVKGSVQDVEDWRKETLAALRDVLGLISDAKATTKELVK